MECHKFLFLMKQETLFIKLITKDPDPENILPPPTLEFLMIIYSYFLLLIINCTNFQLGISNSFVAFDSNINTYKRGYFTDKKELLTDKQLLDFYENSGMDFLRKANELFYISSVVTYNDTIWIHTRSYGKNYLTKYYNGNMISTGFSYGSIISTFFSGESDDSILLYANAEQISECKDVIFDKYRNKINYPSDDNPYIIEFF